MGGDPAVLTRIDHIGVACRDLDAMIAFSQSTCGLPRVSRETNEKQGVEEAMLAVGQAPADAGPPGPVGPPGPRGASYVQLLEPLGPDTPVGRFLDRRGEGIHHVGYGV